MTDDDLERFDADDDAAGTMTPAEVTKTDDGTLDGQRADGDTDAGGIGLAEARSVAVEQAESVFDSSVDNVIKVTSDGDDWVVAIEVVERDAVPDTQDILARYELTIGAGGELTGYGLVDRYKRGDLRGDL